MLRNQSRPTSLTKDRKIHSISINFAENSVREYRIRLFRRHLGLDPGVHIHDNCKEHVQHDQIDKHHIAAKPGQGLNFSMPNLALR